MYPPHIEIQRKTHTEWERKRTNKMQQRFALHNMHNMQHRLKQFTLQFAAIFFVKVIRAVLYHFHLINETFGTPRGLWPAVYIVFNFRWPKWQSHWGQSFVCSTNSVYFVLLWCILVYRRAHMNIVSARMLVENCIVAIEFFCAQKMLYRIPHTRLTSSL